MPGFCAVMRTAIRGKVGHGWVNIVQQNTSAVNCKRRRQPPANPLYNRLAALPRKQKDALPDTFYVVEMAVIETDFTYFSRFSTLC